MFGEAAKIMMPMLQQAMFSINDKKNMWNVNGKLANSRLIGYLPGGKTQSGYSHSLGFGKTSGRFNFNIGEDLANSKYNTRDMGYFTNANYLDHNAWVGYRWIKPKNWYNNIYLNFNAYYSSRLSPSSYQNANFNVNVNGQLKNLWHVGALVGYEPKYNDFYEPREEGYMFRGWSNYFIDGWFETNNAKKYNLYMELMFVKRSLFNSERYNFNLTNRYRFSDKFSVSHANLRKATINNVGFAGLVNFNDANPANDTVVFGRRDPELSKIL